jgi:SAM-dependent methyltransferase
MPDEVGYTRAFFATQRESAAAGARHIVPIALELARPGSVIDIGCGVGAWLAAFAERGVDDVIGMDGEYVEESQLLIPSPNFLPVDLSRPFRLGRRFDLAVSLEVAEHLPADAAREFIDSLTRLAPVVLFSAAVPGQGGVSHVNEQWPAYWAELFRELGYYPVDAVRHRVWNNPEVPWWYAQNTLLFVDGRDRSVSPPSALPLDGNDQPLPLVHPRLYGGVRDAMESITTRQLLTLLPGAVARSVRWRLS